MSANVHVIAEAGTNHNGSLETAKKLVGVAYAAGADSVKFQIIYPEGLYLPRFYNDGKYIVNEVFQKRQAGMLTDDDYRRLAEYCRIRGLPFSGSVFDLQGIKLLDEFNAPYIKIASCDLNNSRLLKCAAEFGRPLIASTGMATLGEIEQAVKDILSTGNRTLVLMHCVSVYPCPVEGMNLSFIDVLKTAFGLPVGLSDHTESSLAAAIAVSKGVSWIEKHFTLDRKSPGFDHAYSMEPEGLAVYLKDVRSCEAACRRQVEKTHDTEKTTRQRAHRALYSARDMTVGEIVTEAEILTVRPEGPLAPNDIYSILGRTLRQPIRQYQAFCSDLFK